jgi:hypothetical protein
MQLSTAENINKDLKVFPEGRSYGMQQNFSNYREYACISE